VRPQESAGPAPTRPGTRELDRELDRELAELEVAVAERRLIYEAGTYTVSISRSINQST